MQRKERRDDPELLVGIQLVLAKDLGVDGDMAEILLASREPSAS